MISKKLNNLKINNKMVKYFNLENKEQKAQSSDTARKLKKSKVK